VTFAFNRQQSTQASPEDGLSEYDPILALPEQKRQVGWGNEPQPWGISFIVQETLVEFEELMESVERVV
jgi:hypothetical protein